MPKYEQLPTKFDGSFVPPTMANRSSEIAWLVIRVHYYADDFLQGTAPFELLGVYIGDGALKAALALCERRYDLVMPTQINVKLPDMTVGHYPLP